MPYIKAKTSVAVSPQQEQTLKAKLGLNDQQVRDALSISNEDWEQIAIRV